MPQCNDNVRLYFYWACNLAEDQVTRAHKVPKYSSTMTSPGWRMQFLSSIPAHQHNSLKWSGIDKWLCSEKWHCRSGSLGFDVNSTSVTSSSDCSVHNWEKITEEKMCDFHGNLPVTLRTNFVIFHSRNMATSPTKTKGNTQGKNKASAEADLTLSGEYA